MQQHGRAFWVPARRPRRAAVLLHCRLLEHSDTGMLSLGADVRRGGGGCRAF
jgi:FtsP/CotA-like multicopper oxidase with cupredoxin domain